jgi:hypothetical protein
MLELAFAHDPTDNSLVILTKNRRLGKEPLKNKEFGEVACDVARRYIGSPNWYDAAMSVEFKLYVHERYKQATVCVAIYNY